MRFNKSARFPACFLAVFSLCLFSGLRPVRASVFQWSAPIEDVISPETKDHPRAFLWIPENCQRVRAIVIADQNMEEEQLFQDVAFRKTLADLGFAEIWIVPAMGSADFRFDQGEDRVLEKLLKTLADQSGYLELADAPLVPTGHSATASWCWDVAVESEARCCRSFLLKAVNGPISPRRIGAIAMSMTSRD